MGCCWSRWWGGRGWSARRGGATRRRNIAQSTRRFSYELSESIHVRKWTFYLCVPSLDFRCFKRPRKYIFWNYPYLEYCMCFDRRTLSMFFLARSRTAQYVVRYLINCTKRSMGRFPNEKTGKRGNFSHMVRPLPTVFSPNLPVFWSLFSVSPISPVSLVVSPVGQVFKTLNYYWSHPFLAWPHVLKLLTQSALCPHFPLSPLCPLSPLFPCLPRHP